ncbi:MAG TPA: PhzF family phenazine biosynthesis protein [Rudaea sp.]|nr:PhzF family phenazine biosynthesis protein [Rudaea sp.]
MISGHALRTSAFKQVDVFTAVPMMGNPLAVILDADGLSSTDMQRIAGWTNLSETSFVLPPTQPGADYRVRIFTPRSELPFAGHPSVGTLHALLDGGRIRASEHIVQECAAGLLPMRIDTSAGDRRTFIRAPRARIGAQDAGLAGLARAAIGAPVRAARAADGGPRWVICDCDNESTVRALAPDMAAVAALCRAHDVIGLCAFGFANNDDYSLVVRVFCPVDGIPEDPVTGSANAAIGAFLRESGQLDAIGTRYRVSQGREMGRNGFVDVNVDTKTGDVEIGGCSVTCVDGTMILPIGQ